MKPLRTHTHAELLCGDETLLLSSEQLMEGKAPECNGHFPPAVMFMGRQRGEKRLGQWKDNGGGWGDGLSASVKMQLGA